jgi:hypothetical protein
MSNDTTIPATTDKHLPITAMAVQLAAAPLLLTVWAFADAGLPWTLYYCRAILTNNASGFMLERLREDWHTWVRAGILVSILAIWLTPCAWTCWGWLRRSRIASTTGCEVIRDHELVFLTVHVIALGMALVLVPRLSLAGLPWRARTAVPAAVVLADALLADWPNELIAERAGWTIGHTDTMSEDRYFIHHGRSESPHRRTSRFAFTEVLGLSLERDPAGDAIVIDLDSFDMADQMNAIVVLRTDDGGIDQTRLREKRIRWHERVVLRARVFLVQFER